MKFSTIITIIASVAVGSANASPSFLRSSVNEDEATCLKACATPEGKKSKDFKKNKITKSAEDCALVHCGGTNRSPEDTACVFECYEDFGKGVEKAIDRAIDECEKKCERSCSSSDKDDEDSKSNDDCKRDCEKECDSGSLDSSTVRKAEKKVGKVITNVDDCIDVCVAPPAAAPTDYKTLKIA